MSVQGVGAKAALAILGALGAEGVSRAITLGDWHTITAAKGIGAKTAQRVVNELKDKAPPQGRCFSIGLAPHAPETASGGTAPRKPETPAGGASREDAVSALTNLGYHESLARQAVATVLRDKGEDTPLNDVIRLSLKELAP